MTDTPHKAAEPVSGEVERAQDPWHPDPEDPFWMLEKADGSWLKNTETQLTTRHPVKAIRYPSEWHADFARRQLVGSGWLTFKPTEHTWINVAAVGQQEQGKRIAELEAETLRLVDALHYAHSAGFQWPVDPLPFGSIAHDLFIRRGNDPERIAERAALSGATE